VRHVSDRGTKRYALRSITVSSDMVNRQLLRSSDAVRGTFACNRTIDPKELVLQGLSDCGVAKIRTNFR
jgi:hypothetical protein